uniref:Slit homolog 2 protein-like n=1 Tax=Echinostoma caproni TaxID=27848 RepID=A0A183ADP6_9TREM
LKNLEQLDISYNFIQQLDSKMKRLRKLRIFNATGNDLLGLSPGLLILAFNHLNTIQLEHNPLITPFSGEFVNGYWSNSPQTLYELVLLKLNEETRLRLIGRPVLLESDNDQNENLSDGWHYWIDAYHLTQRTRSGSCCWCTQARFGPGILVCQHCVDLAGYKQVPITFNCCRPSCAEQAIHCSADEFRTRFYGNPAASTDDSSQMGTDELDMDGRTVRSDSLSQQM